MPAAPDPNPSEKQMELLRFIIAHVSVHGFQPSQSEMAEFFGITKNAIQNRLKELAKRDLVELPAGNRERAVVLKFLEFKPVLTKEARPKAGSLTAKYNDMKSVVFTNEKPQ